MKPDLAEKKNQFDYPIYRSKAREHNVSINDLPFV
jgi:hypothetical protein